jgi:hypothetical protein
MNIYVWCANHEIAREQVEELITRDETTGARILYLTDINYELYNEICSIKEDTNYIELANKLVNQIDEIDDESFADDTVYIVQPAGNPKFQYSLGMVQGENIGNEEVFPVLYAYSKRVSEDIQLPGGGTKNVSVFKHIRFE